MVKNHNVYIKLYLGLIIVFYLTFLYIDLFQKDLSYISTWIKYFSIILTFLFSFFVRYNPINLQDKNLLQMGLFLTVLGDLFLLVLDSHYLLGILLFSLVQIIYTARYSRKNYKPIAMKFFALGLLIFSIFMVLNSYIGPINFIIVASIFYGICFLYSLRWALALFKEKAFPKINRRLILIGMVFFLLCDLNVAIYNILKETNKEGNLYIIPLILIWFFYLPSQAFLVLSGFNYKGKGGR